VDAAKALYHRLIPSRIRNPFGQARRRAFDFLARKFAAVPIPPREILEGAGLSALAIDYRARAESYGSTFIAALAHAGVQIDRAANVLVIPSGSGELLAALSPTSWKLCSTDAESESFAWLKSAYPHVEFFTAGTASFAQRSFDAIVSIERDPTFPPALASEQYAAIVRPEGVVVAAFPTMRSARHAAKRCGSAFDLLFWSEEGLERGMDIAVLRRRSDPKASGGD
jgi:hypothetical protein